MFSVKLKDNEPISDTGSDSVALLDNMADIETHSQFSRIQRQLMALLTRFAASERYLDQMAPAQDAAPHQAGSLQQRAEMKLAILDIVANVMAYCRNVVAKSGR